MNPILFLLMAQALPLAPANVTPIGILAESGVYQGQQCLKLSEIPGKAAEGPGAGIAVVKGSSFRNGVISVEVASTLGAGASAAARGFIGVAFRVSADASKYEYIYLRPANGRADDQVRRNHSIQYSSHPDFPWQRLRKEFPEMYESYVDLEPGVWTKMRIVVKGARAELYVHGNAQPNLIVKDLKLPEAAGAVALWIGPGTVGHFRNLVVSAE
jgi:hypothetical protein